MCKKSRIGKPGGYKFCLVTEGIFPYNICVLNALGPATASYKTVNNSRMQSKD